MSGQTLMNARANEQACRGNGTVIFLLTAHGSAAVSVVHFFTAACLHNKCKRLCCTRARLSLRAILNMFSGMLLERLLGSDCLLFTDMARHVSRPSPPHLGVPPRPHWGRKHPQGSMLLPLGKSSSLAYWTQNKQAQTKKHTFWPSFWILLKKMLCMIKKNASNRRVFILYFLWAHIFLCDTTD